jgi:hypothetical protein
MSHDLFTLTRDGDWGRTRVRCECGVAKKFQTSFHAYEWHDNHRQHPNRDTALVTRPGPATGIGLAMAMRRSLGL